MITDPAPFAALQTQPAQTVLASWIKRIPWSLFLFAAILIVLFADRSRYLTHFGFVYTDGDQVAFWYQADDIAHGIFREPCIYGQNYNVPIEAWAAAPLLVFHVPAYIALPLATTILGLVPFFVIALLAYRHGYRWTASIILLIPLALPIEYTVVSSLPRGFINGLAVATPTIACWLFHQSRKSFFIAGFFSVLALTVNPNCSIILLTAGVFALLTYWRSPRFYIFSLLGASAAVPAPLLIQLFYQYHPQCNAYHPKLPMVFSWSTLKYSLFLADQPTLALNHQELDLFFAHFIPVLEQGWIILVILPALVLLLTAVCRFKAAIAVLIASVFAILCLGIERIHTAYENVFYSGSRMYLALPILFALAWLWFDMGLQERAKNKFRFLVPSIRVLFIICLIGFALSRNVALLDPPSPFVTEAAIVPPVDNVQQLKNDSATVAAACRRYNVSFVLVCNTSCFDDAAPVFSDHAFETLYPFFERRTFLAIQERTRLHTRVLLYQPSGFQTFEAQWQFPKATLVCESPRLLLVELPSPGMTGLNIAAAIGLVYRPAF